MTNPLRRRGRIVPWLAVLLVLCVYQGYPKGVPRAIAEVAGPAACSPGTTAIPTLLNLTVDLQRPNTPAPNAAWAVPVTLTLYPPGDPNSVCYQFDLTLDQTGQWSGVLGLNSGPFDARLRNLHTLRNVRRNILFVSPVNLNMGLLREGDANADNFVDILDFSRLRLSYFAQEGVDAAFNPTADFDESNFVDILDFGLLRGSYFIGGDIELGAASEAGAAAHVSPAAAVTMTLVPDSREIPVGEVAEFIIQVDATAQPLQGVDVELYFAPEVVAVTNAAGTPVASIVPGSAFQTVLQNRVDEAGSRILFSAGNFGEPAQGLLEVARFRLRGIQPGQAQLRFGSHTTAMDANYAAVPVHFPALAVKVTLPYTVHRHFPLMAR